MTIGMRLPPIGVDVKRVTASKPQALGMVKNTKGRLNTYFVGMAARIGQFELFFFAGYQVRQALFQLHVLGQILRDLRQESAGLHHDKAA